MQPAQSTIYTSHAQNKVVPNEKVLFFDLQNEKFSLPLSCVQEILQAVNLLPVPGSFSAMDGLMNVRGRIVPVLDLAAVLGLQTRPIRYSDHLILLRCGDEQIAVRVDRATEIGVLDEMKSGATAIPFANRMLAHVSKHKGRLVSYLNPESFVELLATSRKESR